LEYASIKDQTFDEAIAKILNPVGLRYRVESNEVVLSCDSRNSVSVINKQ